MLKRFAQILALATPMLFVACNGTSTPGPVTPTPGTPTVGFAGTYSGNVTGLNAGPVKFIVDANNKVTGSFSITNRQEDCAPRGGVCETVVEGTVDAAGNIKGNFVDSGIATMHFDGKIVGDTITAGTWGEYIHDPVPDGAFSASRPAGSGTTTTSTKSGSCQGSYVGSIDPPSQEVRLANRDRQLAEGGELGGGEDGGIYLIGNFSFETNANCTVVKSGGDVLLHPITIVGTVNKDFTFNLFSPEGGPVVGKVDANNNVSGQYQEAGKEWVHGVLNGKFTPNGKI